MDINKIFAELGRMHLEVMQLREQLAQAQAQLAELKPKAELAKAE
jgi:hypothetical protein